MNPRDALKADYVREHLSYDAITGDFRWKTDRSNVKAGDLAGCIAPSGYRVIRLGKKNHQAHRLAWLIVEGVWPSEDVDHRDGDRANNRWTNLRAATRSQNLANVGPRSNNVSGEKGVSWHKRAGRWQSHISKDGQSIYLGLFDTVEQAADAYREAAHRLYGDFARTA